MHTRMDRYLHTHFTSICAIKDSQVHMSVYLNPLSDCNSLISIWQLVTMTYCIPLGDCGAVQAPTNGKQFVSGTTVGHSVNYTCNPGYNLLGNSSRTCQDNGQWSGTPSSCSRKLLVTPGVLHSCSYFSIVCKCMWQGILIIANICVQCLFNADIYICRCIYITLCYRQNIAYPDPHLQ